MKNITIFSVVITSILMLGAFSYVTAEEQKEDIDIKIVLDEIKDDFKEYIKDVSQLKPNPGEKSEQVKETYSDSLDMALEKIADESGLDYKNLNSEQQNTLKDLLIQDEFKKVILQNEEDKRGGIAAKKQSFDWLFTPAYATCTLQPEVRYFKQVGVDITGHTNFEGDNDLESVVRTTMSDCSVKYTLTFTDEDHPDPDLDSWYDYLRLYYIYHRIQDIEEFYVNDGISFPRLWSWDQTFFVGIPLHWSADREFSNTVYVSNTWNHLMDTEDTNPSMWKNTFVS